MSLVCDVILVGSLKGLSTVNNNTSDDEELIKTGVSKAAVICGRKRNPGVIHTVGHDKYILRTRQYKKSPDKTPKLSA